MELTKINTSIQSLRTYVRPTIYTVLLMKSVRTKTALKVSHISVIIGYCPLNRMSSFLVGFITIPEVSALEVQV